MTEACNMLLQNPELAYSLLQAQIVMKIVDPQVAMVCQIQGQGWVAGDRSSKHVTTEPSACLRPTAGTDSHENSRPPSSHGM